MTEPEPPDPYAESCREGDAARRACWMLISTVENTGGLVAGGNGDPVPAADVDWVDLADAYLAACEAVGRKPMCENEGEGGR